MKTDEYEKGNPQHTEAWKTMSPAQRMEANRTFWLGHPNSAPLNSGTFPDPRATARKWIVFSTAIAPVWLMLYCENTQAEGVVKDPTAEEWSKAFHAPSSPYLWEDNSRVTLMQEERV